MTERGHVPRRARGSMAVLGATVALLATGATEALAAWPGLNGRLAVTQRSAPPGTPGQRDIWAYAQDAPIDALSRARLPGSLVINEVQPAWSPDGRRLALTRSDEIFLAEAGPSGFSAPVLFTDSPGLIKNTQPAWHPDGTELLFRTNRAEPSRNVADIWRVKIADGHLSATPLIVAPGDQRYPGYSPDGTKVVFRSDADGVDVNGDEEILVLDVASGATAALTNDATADSGPAWSPDGTRIAFESKRDGDMEIFVMNADGTGVQQLTDNEVHDEGPTWSPDGRFIAFTRAPTSGQNDNGDVWVMRPDGSDERQQTGITERQEESPDWQTLPMTVGAPHDPPEACGDLALTPGGVSGVVSRKANCAAALDIAQQWESGRESGDEPGKIEGFDCTSAPHSFDQLVVQCDHRGSRKGVAFVYRVPAS